MYRYMASGLILLIALGAILLGLSKHEPRADLTMVNRGDINTLDPARMSWLQDIRIATAIWEGLTSYHPQTTEPIEGVALLPPQISQDGTRYVFTLRPEARWSNGEPVTAHDFVYAWRRAIEPGTAGDYAFLLTDNIVGAQAYLRWRSSAVRCLTALRDLANGKPIALADARHLAKYVSAPELAQALAAAQAEHDDPATPPAERWQRKCKRLIAKGRTTWRERAWTFLARHLEAMEERFAQVGIRALSDHQLEVRLTRPLPYFLELCAFSTFLPVHRASAERLRSMTPEGLWVYDPQWTKPDYHANGYPGLITNGPFRLAEWRFKRWLLLEKNPFYWAKQQVRSERIKVVGYDHAATAFMAFDRGQVDWLTDLSVDFAPELVAAAQAGRRNDIHSCMAYGTYFYNFNCQQRLPDGRLNPFRDKRVRMAFNLAVDKRALVDSVIKLGNPVATSLVPPGAIAGYEPPRGPEYDPQKARELLAEAGYPEGRGLGPIELLFNTGFGHERVAQAVARMWHEQLGVTVELRGKETKTFADDKSNHRFMIARAGWYGDYGDPTTFLDLLTTGNGNNDSAWSNARYDALIRQACRQRDRKRRMRILAEAEALAMCDEMPILPLYHYVNLYAYRPNVRGITMNPRLINPLKYVYVER